MECKHLFIALATVACFTTAQAQVKVGANPGTINGGSALEVEASDKGLLMPRVSLSNTTTWGLSGTAAAGMSVYNTNASLSSTNAAYPGAGAGEYYWDGTGWVSKKSAAQVGADNGLMVGYNSTGKIGLGGTLAKNTEVKTGGYSLSFSGTGYVGIGVTDPGNYLDISGGSGLYENTLKIRASTHATSRRAGIALGDWQILQDFNGDGTKNFSIYGGTSAANAFVITPSKNVGIGTTLPSTRLDIDNGSTNGAIKIVDGTQGAGKVLMSDANGVGTWQTSASVKPAVLGTLNTTNKSVTGSSLIGSSMTLSQGKWLVHVGQLITTADAATTTKNLWVRIGLSSSSTAISQTGFSSLGSSLASGWLAPSLVNGEGGYSMITGVIPIQVTNASITVYTWFYGIGATSTPITAGIGANGENYFFAIPIN